MRPGKNGGAGVPTVGLYLALIILDSSESKYFAPVRPFVQLPAEHWMEHPLFTLPGIGEFYFTNTLFALLIVDVLVILLAFFFNRAVKKGSLVLKGILGAVEALLEYLYNMTEGTAGKWAKTIFPMVCINHSSSPAGKLDGINPWCG